MLEGNKEHGVAKDSDQELSCKSYNHGMGCLEATRHCSLCSELEKTQPLLETPPHRMKEIRIAWLLLSSGFSVFHH